MVTTVNSTGCDNWNRNSEHQDRLAPTAYLETSKDAAYG